MKTPPRRSHHKRPAPKGSTTTALVRRKAVQQIVPTSGRARVPVVAAPAPVLDVNTLGEDASTGALGLVEVKLTTAEEAVLARPVNVGDVLVKPTGIPYLSHPAYTRLFNEAFGRLGWGIVPRSKPLLNGKSVVMPYILYIHGQPAAFAFGEQEYHENNKEQTYGDAIEATVASALRRCAKRLGIGLELWDKAWLRRFEQEYVVKVWIKEKDKPAFRLKTDPPFWNEVGASGEKRSDASRGAPREEPLVAHNPNGDEVITQQQLKRLWTIIRRTGRQELAVKMWLKVSYGLDSTHDIKRKDYEAVCAAMEHPGPLQLPNREPGSDDV